MIKIPKISFFLLSIITLFFACNKDDNPIEAPTTDLYPLSVGNRLEYNQNDIDGNSNIIPNTDSTLVRSVVTTQLMNGVIAYKITDEIYKNSSLIRSVSSYIYKDANGDVKYLISLQQELMPGFIFGISDWFTFYQKSAGTGKVYTVFKKDTTINLSGTPVPLSIEVSGAVIGQEQVTVPFRTQAYSATRVDISIKISVPGLLSIANGLFFQQWLVEGIGPIKEVGPVISPLRSKGYKMELKNKNF